jgi:methylthioribose-1-phosphate isomerase
MRFAELKLSSLGLRVAGARLEILDQRLLPDQEAWVEVRDHRHMVEIIKTLAVRGAPLIGVAAAMALAHAASRGERDLRTVAADLRASRPTAVNLMWAIDRMLREASDLTEVSLTRVAKAIFEEDVAMCLSMGNNGAPLIQDGDGVLTICNTGGLATVGIGTAFAVLQRAFEQGRRFHVYACETRPLLQGGRLTTWELAKVGIPHTLITDSMAATLMRSGRIQCAFTGADRVSRRGDYANKIGTYNMAVLAKHHGVRFYGVAPWSTVDASCPSGEHIEIEERHADEVRGVAGSFGQVRWAPRDVAVFNPSFDVTPAELVTGLVLDRGVYKPEEFQKLF